MSIVELEHPSPAGAATPPAVAARPPSRLPRRSPGERQPFDDLAVVFPPRRMSGATCTAPVRRPTPEFDPGASATAWLLGEGLELLDPERRRHVVACWRDYRGHGTSLVGDGGCDVRLGGGELCMAGRLAALAWLPLTERELAVFEGGLLAETPVLAVALLVRPPTIWSLADARCVERIFPRGRSFEPERFTAIERQARELVDIVQVARLRRGVARIAAQLPLSALPVASATVASGCTLVDADETYARSVVARQLARYASSALVAADDRAARRAQPTAAATLRHS